MGRFDATETDERDSIPAFPCSLYASDMFCMLLTCHDNDSFG